jgi:2-succinyl-5-enolpyruvyl-6-hydroxy-3-cyclohexene-1-carboxylate synthase
VQRDDVHRRRPYAAVVHVLLRAFADELARCGMRAACTSPGSRSTPLLLALARTEGIEAFSHVDERCAGFFALGHAKATGRPVALACTSGSAAAHYAPAVVEAHEARVPLLVLTADRPPELREVGAGQTIDQIKLYGSAAKWFFEVGDHEATPERLRWMRTLACRAYWTAVEGRPGPVHHNFALREPLNPEGELPADDSGRPDGRPFLTRLAPVAQLAPDALSSVAEIVAATPRGVVVSGREERTPDLPAAVEAFGAAVGYPVLADPLGGARRGAPAIAHYDALLRDEAFAAGQRPALVVRVGDLPTSKPLRAWLRSLDATQVAIDPDGAWQDPDGLVDLSLGLDPASTLFALANLGRRTPDATWLRGWRDADAAAVRAIDLTLGERLSEPRVAAELGEILPPQAIVFVASSMPVRDVETFFGARDDPPRVLSNRGANGIDGLVSTAYGVAASRLGPVVLLIGDVALAHDLGGLLTGSRHGIPLTIVAVDNGGGGIFEFLPVAAQADVFEEHVATPTGLDLARAAALYGARGRRRHHDPPRPDRPRRERRAAPGGLGRGVGRPSPLGDDDHLALPAGPVEGPIGQAEKAGGRLERHVVADPVRPVAVDQPEPAAGRDAHDDAGVRREQRDVADLRLPPARRVPMATAHAPAPERGDAVGPPAVRTDREACPAGHVADERRAPGDAGRRVRRAEVAAQPRPAIRAARNLGRARPVLVQRDLGHARLQRARVRGPGAEGEHEQGEAQRPLDRGHGPTLGALGAQDR